MRRFIILFSLGALTAATAQVVLSLGIHPERLAPLHWILPGVAVFIVGTAMAVTGLLGLGEHYQRLASHLPALLAIKQVDDNTNLPLRNFEAVQNSEHRFWRGYRHAAAALCLFLLSLFSISLLLIEAETSFVHYMAGLSADVAIFGLLGFLWATHALRLTRQSHVSARSTGERLAGLPNRKPEEEKQPIKKPERVQWSNRPSRKRLYRGHLERTIRAVPAR